MSSAQNASQPSAGGKANPQVNDVLFGRGAGVRRHQGNRNLLLFANEHKETYASATASETKDSIAKTILCRIKALSPPGRFLEPVSDTHSDELWYEVDDDKAIAKIKQVLRDPRKSKVSSAGSDRTIAAPCNSSPTRLYSDPQLPLQQLRYQLSAQQALSSNTFPMGMRLASALLWNPVMPFPFGLPQCGAMQGGLMSSNNVARVEPHSGLPPRHGLPIHKNQVPLPDVRLAQHRNEAQQEKAVAARSLLKVERSSNDGGTTAKSPRAEKASSGAKLRNYNDSLAEQSKGERDERHGKRGVPKSSESQSLSVDPEDVEAAQFLLGSMTDTVRKAVAELEREASQTTEEERDNAMVDLFGSLCEIRQSMKRTRRVPVETEISVLLQEMKRELDATPSYDKLALSEAQGTALPVEFTDRRMELFLRRENMDPKRAAQRFVTYWEERRKLFGPEKFHLPMTLKGAMRDDHECLKSGPMFHLPTVDKSGRIISGNILKRHFGDYDERSLLRVFWFYSELNSKHPNASNGVVRYMSVEGASMWDVDMDFIQTTSHLGRTALLLPVCSTHLCGLPSLLSVCAKPLAFTKIDRVSRLRVVVHNCPPMQSAEALHEYGIPADALPKELGGTLDIDEEGKKWFEQLRKLDDEKALQSDEFVWWEL